MFDLSDHLARGERASLPESVDINDLGIWIDPIDATSHYIKGGDETVEEGFVPCKGLQVMKDIS